MLSDSNRIEITYIRLKIMKPSPNNEYLRMYIDETQKNVTISGVYWDHLTEVL